VKERYQARFCSQQLEDLKELMLSASASSIPDDILRRKSDISSLELVLQMLLRGGTEYYTTM